MIPKIRLFEIPLSVRIANEIKFNHEDNEYKINAGGMRINIPSDAQMYSYYGTDITHISLPCCDITLWDTALVKPHITFFPEAYRMWVKE